MPDTILFSLRDEADTRRWASLLARSFAAIPLAEQAFAVHLSGDLGAGKTALARFLLRELGFSGPVKSPTFTLLEPYNSPELDVYHFDLYRFSSPEQWFDAGFDDIIASPGLSLIEWPQNASGALPAPDLRLQLRALDAPAGSDDGADAGGCAEPASEPTPNTADDASDLASGSSTARALRVQALSEAGQRCLSEIRHQWPGAATC